jgi:Ca-activated chloride channel family protein
VLRNADGTSRFISGCGGAALWNSIFYAARLKMKPLAGRRALIVLSDGLDTGSTHSLTDAIEAAQGADTLVYTIVYHSELSGASTDRLERLALEAGGRSFPAPKGSPARIFARIEEDLRNLCVLAFTPPATRDGKFRPLAVKTTRRGVTIRARAGYY